jgi:DsbC/DsbD-like thiol-disulfide interchange protein
VHAQVTPAEPRAGSAVRATVRLHLPPNVHVQSDAPRDPALIATKLTVTPPAGVSVARITYPTAAELRQPGRDQPLAVFSGEVVIEVSLSIAAGVAAGPLTIPAILRYQGCTDRVCFPPAQAKVEWVVAVAK